MSSESPGFVIAMQACLLCAGQDPRREWLIVTRWGEGGGFISVSCTGIAGHGAAPIGLMPVRTALGRMVEPPGRRRRQTFLLCPKKPGSIRLAGRFLRAEGYLHLSGNAMRLTGEGRFANGSSRAEWRLHAAHVSWTGEHFDRGFKPGPAAKE